MSAGGRWRLTVRDEFAAAHALRHYQGKCENPHGHNFAVELCVEGSELAPDTELLVDFGTLKGALRASLAALDHRMLNETPPFDVCNPSSENLARHIFYDVAARLAASDDPQAAHARLVSVSVSERASQTATYMEA
ncbi:MAG: 6-carboxytetrahydropterin synthase QueD [Desulfovibrio sp.]|nr:6-carboxytetrahydropterin synthase QueD [Desulfovibrio sp.]